MDRLSVRNGIVMFDINEYYIEKDLITESASRLDNAVLPPGSAIEQEIETIISDTIGKKYGRLKFKRRDHTIDIFTPQRTCPFAGEFSIHADYFRFLLSVYPDCDDLKHISRIIVRPRFIESDGIQLVSLYSKRFHSLLLYFSCPHAYRFSDCSFFTHTHPEIDISSITDPHYLGTASGNDPGMLTIPPLFYIMKTISRGPVNALDTYLLKPGPSVDTGKLTLLDEISHYYNQHGY